MAVDISHPPLDSQRLRACVRSMQSNALLSVKALQTVLRTWLHSQTVAGLLSVGTSPQRHYGSVNVCSTAKSATKYLQQPRSHEQLRVPYHVAVCISILCGMIPLAPGKSSLCRWLRMQQLQLLRTRCVLVRHELTECNITTSRITRGVLWERHTSTQALEESAADTL